MTTLSSIFTGWPASRYLCVSKTKHWSPRKFIFSLTKSMKVITDGQQSTSRSGYLPFQDGSLLIDVKILEVDSDKALTDNTGCCGCPNQPHKSC